MMPVMNVEWASTRPADQLDVLCSPQQFGEQSAHLHSRQLVTHAEVRTSAKRNMRIGRTIDTERTGVGKYGLVAIARIKEQRQ